MIRQCNLVTFLSNTCTHVAKQSISVGCIPAAWKSYISFSGHHQMSLWGSSLEQVWTGIQWSPPGVTNNDRGGILRLMSRGFGLGGSVLYIEIQCMTGKWPHGTTPCRQNDGQTRLQTLPSVTTRQRSVQTYRYTLSTPSDTKFPESSPVANVCTVPTKYFPIDNPYESLQISMDTQYIPMYQSSVILRVGMHAVLSEIYWVI